MKDSTMHLMDNEILSRLPVPEIREETFQHSYKQVVCYPVCDDVNHIINIIFKSLFRHTDEKIYALNHRN